MKETLQNTSHFSKYNELKYRFLELYDTISRREQGILRTRLSVITGINRDHQYRYFKIGLRDTQDCPATYLMAFAKLFSMKAEDLMNKQIEVDPLPSFDNRFITNLKNRHNIKQSA